jgi:hypothetical protein
MIHVVIRRCCLGPNCSRNHGASCYNHSTQTYEDKRVWVTQYVTFIKSKAEEVCVNWKQYDSQIVSGTEALKLVAEDNRAWLINKMDQLHQAEAVA